MPYCYRHPDRETGLACSECGRPICTECMTVAPVGLRCPDHSGRPQGVARMRSSVRRASYSGTGAIVTKLLIGLNVAVYLAELGQGGNVNGIGSSIFDDGYLRAHEVASGDWWRLLTAAFLHYGPFHLGLNMLALWWFGAPLEEALGRGRYLLLYLVSGLAGSAGALLLSPNVATVGASGAIFGILGAALVLERQGTPVFGGALTLIVINLVFTFSVGNISVGGHLGGLAGGILGTLALSRFGRGHAVYGRVGLLGVAGLVLIGAASILVSYLKVRGYA
ncbi:MAG TPA: rhomboid family intramembrane serine protease [Gaiellaceae bacterium]|jgi:membrane associated rhomboid family serine protease|nr:rhomboid family intramembrane serine protease [Gaiellaceae bacterium]